MTYEEYSALANEAAKLHQAGAHAEALAIFETLAETDIAAFDRGNMFMNAAHILAGMDQTDAALAAYDKAVALHLPLCRSDAAAHRAALLHKIGRAAEALAQFQRLAAEPWASEQEKYFYGQNVATISAELKR